MPRPRPGDWLDDDIRGMRRAGVDVLVCLLTDEEISELDLVQEPESCAQNGIEHIRFPIEDRSVPSPDHRTGAFVQSLADRLSRGLSVAVHCRMGLGRSALVAGCVLGFLGQSVEDAFLTIAEARGYNVPDTEEQREWVRDFVREHTRGTA